MLVELETRKGVTNIFEDGSGGPAAAEGDVLPGDLNRGRGTAGCFVSLINCISKEENMELYLRGEE